MKVLCSIVLGSLATCLLAGCGSDETVRPSGEPVSGMITWQGEPLESGEIELTPESGPSATVPVVDGSYITQEDIGVTKGPTAVRITVNGAAMASGPGVPEEERGVRDILGTATKSIDVPEGGGSFDFDLTKEDLRG